MTLSVLLASNPDIEHPPLLLIGRPDEEIGRMAAVEGLAGFYMKSPGEIVREEVEDYLPYLKKFKN